MPQAVCELCGLPAGGGPIQGTFNGAPKPFCCPGCLNVYAILLESGALAQGVDFKQTDIYQQSLKLGLISSGRAAQASIPEGVETREGLYQLSGLWCTSCGWLIEHALRRERGVVSAEVLFTSDLLKVRYAPQYVEPDRIPRRVASLGYQAVAYSGGREGERAAWRDLLLRLGLAFGLWMNVMLFSLVIYASYFEGVADWARRVVPFILMALAAPAVFYSGWPVLRIAAHGLRERVIRMEALIATGVLAAYGYSSAQAFLGGRHYYFDTACAIVTLVLAGKALERGAKEKTVHAIALLHRLMPRKARVMAEGRERFVSVDALQPGMDLLVKPGERIPADGTILEGSTAVDESVVTGESAPRSKGRGDAVVGGSLNGAGVIEVRVTRAGGESTLAHIVRAVEDAVANRTQLERAVDRVSRVFVPAVMFTAVATFAGWSLAGMAHTEALLRAIAVLVIACPCALGIATPLATTAAVGAASRRGILIRDARVLETIRRVDVLALDKTGTVTEGQFRVQALARAAGEDALGLAASLESRSEHPVAAALVRYARENGAPLEPARDIEVRRGLGILGTVAGRRVVVGNWRLMEAEGIEFPPELREQAGTWESKGLTLAWGAVDGAGSIVAACGDSLRPEAAGLVRTLNASGVRTMLLSGDSPEAVAQTAREAGVAEYRGGATPEEKAEAVAALRRGGQVVAMAGDGINDAPALAAADLGIAMGSGADLAMQAAPVVLMSGSLLRIAETFHLARFTLRVVRQNLFWAFFYNAAGITLAVAGVLNPILAAGAMVLSSLSVIGNSLRLNARDR